MALHGVFVAEGDAPHRDICLLLRRIAFYKFHGPKPPKMNNSSIKNEHLFTPLFPSL
jgi:hypothetical protein